MPSEVWNLVGLGISMVVACAAFARASTRAGHYDGAVYGMTPLVHRRYAAVALALALAFAIALFWPPMPTVILLGATALVAVFYLTSFLRGAEADD
jgi:hypothetical protein